MLLVASNLEEYARETALHLKSGDMDKARQTARQLSALRTARILAELPLPTVVTYLTSLGWIKAADIAGYLPPPLTVTVLQEMNEEDAGSLLAEMAPERMTDVLAMMPEAYAQSMLSQLAPDYRRRIEALAAWEDGTAGAVMSPHFLSVEPDTLVSEAIESVRSAPSEMERTAYLFVVAPDSGVLQGVISLRELMLSDPSRKASEIMTPDVLAIRATDDAVEAARRIRSRRLKMLPVVDDSDVLVGIISIGQSMDLLAHTVADSMVAISAGSPDESFYTPPREAVRRRLPWMAANVFLNLGAVAVISSFENTIVQVAILAAFLPMITDMGGNVGIQALSVSIRSIALGEARLIDFWKAMRKELAIGLINGLALGAMFSVIAWFLQGNIVLGVIAGLALGLNVLLAGVVGGTIPFLIKRMGKDPAMMTGPILTTITDITGVTVYLGLATLFLSSLMAG